MVKAVIGKRKFSIGWDTLYDDYNRLAVVVKRENLDYQSIVLSGDAVIAASIASLLYLQFGGVI